MAASQNISGAQRYLANVQFPYCAPPEVETLNKVRLVLALHSLTCGDEIVEGFTALISKIPHSLPKKRVLGFANRRTHAT